VWCFDVIESLVDKSLLQRSGDRRFVLPESLRAFVEERSSDDAARDRHARYFAGRLEEWEGRRWDAASLDEAWMDVPNLLAAAERTVESAPQLAGRAVLAAHLVLRHRGQTAVHLDALELGLRAAPEFRAALLC